MQIKELIEELQKLDGERSIAVASIQAEGSLIVIKHNISVVDIRDIDKSWHRYDMNKYEGGADYIIR